MLVSIPSPLKRVRDLLSIKSTSKDVGEDEAEDELNRTEQNRTKPVLICFTRSPVLANLDQIGVVF